MSLIYKEAQNSGTMGIPSHFSQSICGLGSFIKIHWSKILHLRPQNAANETKTHTSPSYKVNLAFAKAISYLHSEQKQNKNMTTHL